MPGFVYILKSNKNGRYYIGSTKDLEKRLKWHQRGYCKYTKNILPVELVFWQEYGSLVEARQVEYRLKKKKSRVIIEAVIRDGKIGARSAAG